MTSLFPGGLDILLCRLLHLDFRHVLLNLTDPFDKELEEQLRFVSLFVGFGDHEQITGEFKQRHDFLDLLLGFCRFNLAIFQEFLDFLAELNLRNFGIKFNNLIELAFVLFDIIYQQTSFFFNVLDWTSHAFFHLCELGLEVDEFVILFVNQFTNGRHHTFAF